MAPVEQDLIKKTRVVAIYRKYDCEDCDKVKKLFEDKKVEVTYVEFESANDKEKSRIDELFKEHYVNDAHHLQTFVNGHFLGNCKETLSGDISGKQSGLLTYDEEHNYEYDLVVIGGGSGGLAASKEAARLGRKVAVCDFVTETPRGTTWGLGGTCVNVGCIPKKLMHQAAIIGELKHDSKGFGWPVEEDQQKVDWNTMVENIQSHIGSLNWGYRVALRDKKVKYLNAYASFVNQHTLNTINKSGKETQITTKYIIVCTGTRPKYPNIPGAKEFGITSDDLFSLPYNPGKTLLIGASYISLECAGFLNGIKAGSVTVMVRSILLRGFDQQMANIIGDYMEEHGINFVRKCVPTKLEQIEDGKPGKIKVFGKYDDGTVFEDWFNTVVFAIGREAVMDKLAIEKSGVKINPNSKKILADDEDRTNIPHIFAIGDINDGKPELTPVAIQAGILLARRICKISQVKMDYHNIPTTVFSPVEYGCIGYSEEDAVDKFGDENVEIYHKNFWPLEWTLPKRSEKVCYSKLICLKNENEKVIGLHYLGPNAGEVTQGFGGMVLMGATKGDFDRLVGIHPTCAEVFTTMDITKRSGVSPEASGC